MVAERIVLRAELRAGDRIAVGHTIHISESGVIVQTDEEAPLGTRVEVTLSFAGVIDRPCSLEAELIARRIATGPGEPATWELRWTMSDRSELDALLARLRDAGGDRQLRILLVEDSQMVRQVFELGVSRMLQSRCGPLTLDCVEDAETGWDKLRAADYDVAIIDCLLPGIQGPELIRRLRSDSAVRQIPIVAISVAGETMRQSALEAGADVFVHKPVVVRDLLATLERLGLGGH